MQNLGLSNRQLGHGSWMEEASGRSKTKLSRGEHMQRLITVITVKTQAFRLAQHSEITWFEEVDKYSHFKTNKKAQQPLAQSQMTNKSQGV